jgi:hypothetical protein
VQTASLAFTIVGSVLLVLDLATLIRRFSSNPAPNVGLSMCCIGLGEDIPQLVITVL